MDNFDSLSGSCQWNVSFLHSLNDWEVEDLTSFYSLLFTLIIWVAGLTKFGGFRMGRGKFEVRSFYNILISNVNFPFPWKSIWHTKAPPRVAFFVQSAALGKILTLDNLRKKIWC